MDRDQGLPVQLGKSYAYVPGPHGRVEALVTWNMVDDELFAHVYALVDKGVPSRLPRPGQRKMSERLQMLIDADALVPYEARLLSDQHVYRIFSRDVGWTILVSLADTAEGDCHLVPGGIYGYFPNGEEDPNRIGIWPSHVTRDLLHTWDVMRTVLRVNNAEDAKLVRKSRDSIIIWDLGAIYNNRNRHTVGRPR